MKQLIQPNLWSCLPTAFAMALDMDLQHLLKIVGHDGSEIVWSTLPEPECRRSFHIQEMIWVADRVGMSVTPFESFPCLCPMSPIAREIEIEPLGDFEAMLLTAHRAVITGVSPLGSRHAVAWNGSKVYCPSGTTYSIEDFGIETLWLIREIKAG